MTPKPFSFDFQPEHVTRRFVLGRDACGQPVVRPRAEVVEAEKRWRDLATITGLTPGPCEDGLVRFEGASRVFGHRADIRVRAEAV